jgi:hypothetical protein
MRLLHSSTLVLKEFNDAAIPSYAILSYTWKAGEEATLAEMQKLNLSECSYVVGQNFGSSFDDLQRLHTTQTSGYVKSNVLMKQHRRMVLPMPGLILAALIKRAAPRRGGYQFHVPMALTNGSFAMCIFQMWCGDWIEETNY